MKLELFYEQIALVFLILRNNKLYRDREDVEAILGYEITTIFFQK